MKDRPRYPHLKITEKEKGEKPLLLKHRHPKQTKGELTFTNQDGNVLRVAFSAPSEIQTEFYKGSFDERWRNFHISGNLYVAIAKNNPDKVMFFLNGNRRATIISKSALKHVPNRILRILKEEKNRRSGA